MMNFLTRENHAFVTKICGDFLAEKHRIAIAEPKLGAIVAEVMQAVAPSGGSLEELNKKTIIAVRNRVLAADTPAVIDRGQSDRAEVEDETSFMAKLKQLEMLRNMPISAPVAPAPAQQTPLVVPATPAQPQITTVYTTQPPRMARPFYINGWDRPWHEIPQRATWIWNGPLPVNIDLSSLQFVRACLPRVTGHPYLVLHISGAGGQRHEIPLVAEAGGISKSEGQWSAATAALLPALAVPWTIALRTPMGELLDLGADNAVISEVDGPHIILDRVAKIRNGDILYVHLRSEKVAKVEVDAASGKQVVAAANVPTELVGGHVLVYSQQACLIFDGTQQLH
jgi:hypothetical protein